MSVTESVEKNNLIFGPINSRRFGMSLGIDLSPFSKQCNFDCLYCELAPSATVAQQSKSIDVATIIAAVQEHLDDSIDVITLTANGEPTLYPHLKQLITQLDTVKNSAQTLILTNSATLTDTEVFDALLQLDQVKLSLDAISEDIFKKIDRPHPSIKISQITQALKKFAQEFQGKLFIEILFVQGINNTPQEIQKLNQFLVDIDVTRIDIGTIDRPPAYNVTPLDYEDLLHIAQQFDSRLPIHIASRKSGKTLTKNFTKEAIINTLDKRPLTQEDIELLFDEDSKKRLLELIEDGSITQEQRSNLHFYRPTKNIQRKRVKKATQTE